MTLAERLLAVVLDEGFGRLRQDLVRGRSEWQMWIRDGVVHIFQGPSLDDVVAQAEARIARRTP